MTWELKLGAAAVVLACGTVLGWWLHRPPACPPCTRVVDHTMTTVVQRPDGTTTTTTDATRTAATPVAAATLRRDWGLGVRWDLNRDSYPAIMSLDRRLVGDLWFSTEVNVLHGDWSVGVKWEF